MRQTITILIICLFMSGISLAVSADEIKTITLKVDGMTCTLCVPAVKKAIQRIDGVKKADVIYKDGKAIVEHDSAKTNTQNIIKAIEGVGYKASLLEEKKK